METTLKAWSYPKDYIGEDLTGQLCVISRNRDSDALAESNFAYTLRELGGETGIEDDGTREGSGVYVASFNHWACGWYELILIDPTAPDAEKAVRKAEEILARLEDYPILDEDDFSSREDAEWCRCLSEGFFDDDIAECLSEVIGRDVKLEDSREANRERMRALASPEFPDHISRSETRYAIREELGIAQ